MVFFNKKLLLESQDTPELFNLHLTIPKIFWDNYDIKTTRIITFELAYLDEKYDSIGMEYMNRQFLTYKESVLGLFNYLIVYLLHPDQIKNNISKNEYINWLHEIMENHPIQLFLFQLKDNLKKHPLIII